MGIFCLLLQAAILSLITCFKDFKATYHSKTAVSHCQCSKSLCSLPLI